MTADHFINFGTQEIKKHPYHIIAISYRLTPKVGEGLIYDLLQKIRELNLNDTLLFLGCLPELAEICSAWNVFDRIFTRK